MFNHLIMFVIKYSTIHIQLVILNNIFLLFPIIQNISSILDKTWQIEFI